MHNISALQIVFLAALFLLLILFSVLGYRAMRPEGRQSDIYAFWISIMLFLASLAVYLAVYASPLLGIAPLIPLFIFAKIFIATQKNKKK